MDPVRARGAWCGGTARLLTCVALALALALDLAGPSHVGAVRVEAVAVGEQRAEVHA